MSTGSRRQKAGRQRADAKQCMVVRRPTQAQVPHAPLTGLFFVRVSHQMALLSLVAAKQITVRSANGKSEVAFDK